MSRRDGIGATIRGPCRMCFKMVKGEPRGTGFENGLPALGSSKTREQSTPPIRSGWGDPGVQTDEPKRTLGLDDLGPKTPEGEVIVWNEIQTGQGSVKTLGDWGKKGARKIKNREGGDKTIRESRQRSVPNRHSPERIETRIKGKRILLKVNTTGWRNQETIPTGEKGIRYRCDSTRRREVKNAKLLPNISQ